MTFNKSIIFHHVDYSLTAPNRLTLFHDLCLTIGLKKIGLVGKNGVGKSTLFKLIVGEIKPCGGAIEIEGDYAYCSQQPYFKDASVVSDLLGISERLHALNCILQGSTEEHNFSILNDQWDIADRSHQQLTAFGLGYLSLDHSVTHLSGGETTRLMLARAFLQDPDFLLLDEPTNNLDITSRQFLYGAIEHWKKGVVVISHDRALLSKMDSIIELTTLGVENFGGNYDQYLIQKEILLTAKEQDVADSKKTLAQAKASIQASYEKREQKQSKGRGLFLSGKIDRITANSKKGRCERTQSKNATQAFHMQKSAAEKLQDANSKLEVQYEIQVTLPKTHVPNGKVILQMEEVSYQFSSHVSPIIKQFNFTITGPERVAIVGKNGSGKTTLVKLILGLITPSSGKIINGVSGISYLDQHAKILNAEQTVLDNFLRLNPAFNEQQAHQSLAQFLFRNVAALKKVNDLSGGERLRALLACVLLGETPPKFLILDEPTNHLDLDSILRIEVILNEYQGALIVTSHDSVFLNNIKATRIIEAPFINNR